MDLLQALILALVQGLTEFLPVSSSAHLVLVPVFTDWPDQGLAFDVALNTATWLAVVVYFRGDLTGMASGLVRSLKDRSFSSNPDGRLAWMVLLATIPVGAAGLLFHDFIEENLRSTAVVAWSSIVWGLVLFAADRRAGSGDFRRLGWAGAVFVGLSQALALVPGTSRSGITITAGLFAGMSRTSAARFSFLLAVVVGALAGGLEGVKMIERGWDTPWGAVAVGMVVAFIAAYAAIHYFLKIISSFSMTPFVVYRVALGAGLLLLF